MHRANPSRNVLRNPSASVSEPTSTVMSVMMADQVAINYRKADITPRQRAMLDFAMKVSRKAEEISEADCLAEGLTMFDADDIPLEIQYEQLWDSINGKTHPWKSNPWVWVINFKKL